MGKFFLKSTYFEFNSNVKHQISGKAIGTKFAPNICLYIYGLHGDSVSQKWTNSALDLVQGHCHSSLRMRRIFPKKRYLVANVRKLKDWFKKRVCPEDMVNKETKRALESPSLGRSKTSGWHVSGNGGTGIPLVVNFNYILCCLGLPYVKIRKNLCFIYEDEQVK